jgi:hypothetical protein
VFVRAEWRHRHITCNTAPNTVGTNDLVLSLNTSLLPLSEIFIANYTQ